MKGAWAKTLQSVCIAAFIMILDAVMTMPENYSCDQSITHAPGAKWENMCVIHGERAGPIRSENSKVVIIENNTEIDKTWHRP